MRRAQRVDRLLRGHDPVARVLLGPARLRPRHVERRVARADDRLDRRRSAVALTPDVPRSMPRYMSLKAARAAQTRRARCRRRSDVLAAVELVGDRRVADAADAGVPQRRAVARSSASALLPESPVNVSPEAVVSTPALPAPPYRSWRQRTSPVAIVERAQLAAAVHGVVGAGPAVLAVLGLEEVDAVSVGCAHDEQTRRRVEARRSVVRGADLIGRDEAAVARRLFVGVRDRPPVRVRCRAPSSSWRRVWSTGSCPSCGRAPRSSRCARPAAAACGPRRRTSRRRAPALRRHPNRACRAARPGNPT